MAYTMPGTGWTAVGEGMRALGQTIADYYAQKREEQRYQTEEQRRREQDALNASLRELQMEATRADLARGERQDITGALDILGDQEVPAELAAAARKYPQTAGLVKESLPSTALGTLAGPQPSRRYAIPQLTSAQRAEQAMGERREARETRALGVDESQAALDAALNPSRIGMNEANAAANRAQAGMYGAQADWYKKRLPGTGVNPQDRASQIRYQQISMELRQLHNDPMIAMLRGSAPQMVAGSIAQGEETVAKGHGFPNAQAMRSWMASFGSGIQQSQAPEQGGELGWSIQYEDGTGEDNLTQEEALDLQRQFGGTVTQKR